MDELALEVIRGCFNFNLIFKINERFKPKQANPRASMFELFIAILT
jgi:hypothetical protein